MQESSNRLTADKKMRHRPYRSLPFRRKRRAPSLIGAASSFTKGTKGDSLNFARSPAWRDSPGEPSLWLLRSSVLQYA